MKRRKWLYPQNCPLYHKIVYVSPTAQMYIPHRGRAAYERYLEGMISVKCVYLTYTCFGFLRKLSKIIALSHMSSLETDRHTTLLIIRSFEC